MHIAQTVITVQFVQRNANCAYCACCMFCKRTAKHDNASPQSVTKHYNAQTNMTQYYKAQACLAKFNKAQQSIWKSDTLYDKMQHRHIVLRRTQNDTVVPQVISE